MLPSPRSLRKGSLSANVTGSTNSLVISIDSFYTPGVIKMPNWIIIEFWNKSLNPFRNFCQPASIWPYWSVIHSCGNSCPGKALEVFSWSVINVPSHNNYHENISKGQYNDKLSLVSFLKFFSSLNQLPKSLRGL